MVRVGDRVHVKDLGYGRVVDVQPHLLAPVCVKLDAGDHNWVYQSNVTVLRPPEIGPQDIEVMPKTLETLIRGFEDYATHRSSCLADEVGTICGCGYARAKAQVETIRKMVGL